MRPCPMCKGLGKVWIDWYPSYVRCSSCRGTGEVPALTNLQGDQDG